MKQILIPAIAFVMLFSCKSKTTETGPAPQTAKEYNEKIIDLEESLSEPLLKAEAEIKVRGERGDFPAMAQSAKAMEDTVDTRINALKKMEPVGKGGEDFKTVSVRYFEYIKSIYTSYKNIADAKDDAARGKANEEMIKVMNAQTGVMANLKATQDKFAADNAFTIEK